MKLTKSNMLCGGALLFASLATGYTAWGQHPHKTIPAESKMLEERSDGHAPSRVSERDLAILFELVEEARAELHALRVQAGLDNERRESDDRHERRESGERHEGREGRGEHRGREGRGEHGGREGREEHGGGEGRERRGEHGGGEDGEERNERVPRNEAWEGELNGAHLTLAYNAETQSFQGTVRNTTREVLSEVRVEVHLSNGAELGPTRRIDLAPGESADVELSAAGQRFIWWTTHPESGNEEHGEGHDEGGHEEGGEGGEGGGNRPSDSGLRPLYNELLLLKHEIELLRRDAREGSRRRG